MFNYDELLCLRPWEVHFRLPGTGDPPVCVGDLGHWEQNLQKFFSIVRRFACLDVGFELRSTDLGALMSMLTYSAIAWDSRGSVDNRQQRTIVNMLAGGKVNTRRCLEVCLGLLSPIHRSSIPEALLHEQVSILYRLLNTNADFQQVVRSHFHLCSNMRDPPTTTFFCSFSACTSGVRLGVDLMVSAQRSSGESVFIACHNH